MDVKEKVMNALKLYEVAVRKEAEALMHLREVQEQAKAAEVEAARQLKNAYGTRSVVFNCYRYAYKSSNGAEPFGLIAEPCTDIIL